MAKTLSFIKIRLIKAGQHVYFCRQVHKTASRITDKLVIRVDQMTREKGQNRVRNRGGHEGKQKWPLNRWRKSNPCDCDEDEAKRKCNAK